MAAYPDIFSMELQDNGGTNVFFELFKRETPSRLLLWLFLLYPRPRQTGVRDSVLPVRRLHENNMLLKELKRGFRHLMHIGKTMLSKSSYC